MKIVFTGNLSLTFIGTLDEIAEKIGMSFEDSETDEDKWNAIHDCLVDDVSPDLISYLDYADEYSLGNEEVKKTD